MSKKILSVVLTLAMIVSLFACTSGIGVFAADADKETSVALTESVAPVVEQKSASSAAIVDAYPTEYYPKHCECGNVWEDNTGSTHYLYGETACKKAYDADGQFVGGCDGVVHEWTLIPADTDIQTTDPYVNGGYFYLGGNVTTKQITVTESCALHIDLNGFKLSQKSGSTSNNGRTFGLSNADTTLTITDTSADGTGKLVGGYADGNSAKAQGGVVLASGANSTLVFYSGTVSNNTHGSTIRGAYAGGLVYANGTDGVLIAFDVTFRGGHAMMTTKSGVTTKSSVYGGAFYIGCKSYFRGSTITGGTAYGGLKHAVAGDEGTDVTACGGNVYVTADGTFDMDGGTISDGYCPSYTGTSGKATAGGQGGNLYSKGTVTIKNATITGGTASDIGGNVFLNYDKVAYLENVTVTNGTSGYDADGKTTFSNKAGGNVYAATNATFKNCTIYGGKSSQAYSGNFATNSAYAILTVDSCTIDSGFRINKLKSGYPIKITGDTKIDQMFISPVDISKDANTSNVQIDIAGLTDKNLLGVNVYANGSYKFAIKEDGPTPSNRVYFVNAPANFADFIAFNVASHSFVYHNSSEEKGIDEESGDPIYYNDGDLTVTKSSGTRIQCVCCGKETGDPNHVCENLLWKNWSNTTTLPSKNGNYFLVSNVKVTGQKTYKYTEANGVPDIKIDLNGKSIGVADSQINMEGTGSSRIISLNETNNDYKLQGKFVITNNASSGTLSTCRQGEQGCVIWNNNFASLDLYNVKIDASQVYSHTHEYDKNGTPTTIKTGSGAALAGGSNTTTNLYNTTVIGGKTDSSGGAIYISPNGKLNCYNSTIKDGTAANGGGNIFASTDTNVHLEGCTISGGTVTTGRGGNVYISDGGNLDVVSCIIDGGVCESESVTYGANIYGAGAAMRKATDEDAVAGRCTAPEVGSYCILDEAGSPTVMNISGKTVITDGSMPNCAEGTATCLYSKGIVNITDNAKIASIFVQAYCQINFEKLGKSAAVDLFFSNSFFGTKRNVNFDDQGYITAVEPAVPLVTSVNATMSFVGGLLNVSHPDAVAEAAEVLELVMKDNQLLVDSSDITQMRNILEITDNLEVVHYIAEAVAAADLGDFEAMYAEAQSFNAMLKVMIKLSKDETVSAEKSKFILIAAADEEGLGEYTSVGIEVTINNQTKVATPETVYGEICDSDAAGTSLTGGVTNEKSDYFYFATLTLTTEKIAGLDITARAFVEIDGGKVYGDEVVTTFDSLLA